MSNSWDTWDRTGQERFAKLVSEFWPQIAAKEEVFGLWFKSLVRYPLELVLSVLKDRRAIDPREPSLKAIQGALNDRMRSFRRSPEKLDGPVVTAQEVAGEDPDGFWELRESGPLGDFYKAMRGALFEGKSITYMSKQIGHTF